MIVAFVFGALALQTCDGGGIFRAIDSRDVQLLSTYTNNSEIVNSRNAKAEIPIMGECLLFIVKPIFFCLTQRRGERRGLVTMQATPFPP